MSYYLDHLARVRIADGKISLLASLNPDASVPIQGEEYGDAWTLSIEEASKRVAENGFWNTWTTISGEVCGGIYLTDGLSEEEALRFVCGEMNLIQDMADAEIAVAIRRLAPGEYVFSVEP